MLEKLNKLLNSFIVIFFTTGVITAICGLELVASVLLLLLTLGGITKIFVSASLPSSHKVPVENNNSSIKLVDIIENKLNESQYQKKKSNNNSYENIKKHGIELNYLCHRNKRQNIIDSDQIYDNMSDRENDLEYSEPVKSTVKVLVKKGFNVK